jgi:hypothetical protein
MSVWKKKPLNLGQIRFHAEMVLAGLDAIERASGRPDQRILDFLERCENGCSTDALARCLRIRRQTVLMTVRLMEAANKIARVNGRWRVQD